MARLEDQAALAAEPGDLAHEPARGLDAAFRFGAGAFSILLLLIAWELFARSGKVTMFMLPPFSAVVERIYSDALGGDLWINLGLTLYRAMTGFFIAAMGGIAGVEKELVWSARNMGANERQVMWQVVLPAALPQILTGLQVALPIALIVEIVVEMAMGGYGLGGAMMNASRFADSRGVFAGIVEIAIIGYALIRTMALIRGRLLAWHHEAEHR